MRSSWTTIVAAVLGATSLHGRPTTTTTEDEHDRAAGGHGCGPHEECPVSAKLYAELEELARVVDVAYCVGTTGIQKPFLCASRCQDFKLFELTTTWNTGPLLSDSCGYIALDHSPTAPRIILAFRGTYSIANTIIDLSTVPQKYVPYPPDDDDDDAVVVEEEEAASATRRRLFMDPDNDDDDDGKCTNCTVHAGFLFSWIQTRTLILPDLERLTRAHPTYQLTLVGHSLGGAVAALAALDFHRRGWAPHVTTFGEPRVGNDRLAAYLDARFPAPTNTFRRLTHIHDPVPLLPPAALGYRMHAGEIYIANPTHLPPPVVDLRRCHADADPRCIAAAGSAFSPLPPLRALNAHRDYFWRLGLCVPGGDPTSSFPSSSSSFSSLSFMAFSEKEEKEEEVLEVLELEVEEEKQTPWFREEI